MEVTFIIKRGTWDLNKTDCLVMIFIFKNSLAVTPRHNSVQIKLCNEYCVLSDDRHL